MSPRSLHAKSDRVRNRLLAPVRVNAARSNSRSLPRHIPAHKRMIAIRRRAATMVQEIYGFAIVVGACCVHSTGRCGTTWRARIPPVLHYANRLTSAENCGRSRFFYHAEALRGRRLLLFRSAIIHTPIGSNRRFLRIRQRKALHGAKTRRRNPCPPILS